MGTFCGQRRGGGGSKARPEGWDERYGACPDEIEEARAELYREQAETVREEREKEEGDGTQ